MTDIQFKLFTDICSNRSKKQIIEIQTFFTYEQNIKSEEVQ